MNALLPAFQGAAVYGLRYYRCLIRVTASSAAIQQCGAPLQPAHNWMNKNLNEERVTGRAYTHFYK